MQILDGKFVAQQICNQIQKEVATLEHQHQRKPTLYIFLIGNRPESRLYVNSKMKRCEEIGFEAKLCTFDDTISQQDLQNEIVRAAENKNVNGIMVQLPLPKHIDENKTIACIPPHKDVDGMHYENLGRICYNDNTAIVPATPLGVLLLLEHYNVFAKGQHCVIVGRSQIVGRPLSILLSNQNKYGNGTVTLCHSHTKGLAEICKQADILIAAIGKPEFIDASMIKQGAVVVDVGINEIPFDNPRGKKLVGDVAFHAVAPHCSYITPVPGGVGPMTIAALMYNTLKVFKQQILS